jgi:hypothetical protein
MGGGGQTQIQERDLINLGYVTQAVYSLLFVTGIIMFSPNVTVLWVASKGKTVQLRHAGAKGKRKYSSYSILTSALDRMSGQRHDPARLYSQEKDTVTHWIGG